MNGVSVARPDRADATRAGDCRSEPALLGLYRMGDLMAKTLATQRVEVALLSAMGALALLLSAVGIFALVANMVAQKTREIGIRIALGATIRQAMIHIGSAGSTRFGPGNPPRSDALCRSVAGDAQCALWSRRL